MPAFGRGERMGEDKLWADVGGRPLIALTLQALADARVLDVVVIVAPEARRARILEIAFEAALNAEVVEGGARRQDSVAAGLAQCPDTDIVVVHDAARPLARPQLFADVLDAATEDGAAITALPLADAIKQVSGNHVVATLERRRLLAAQTPQAFRFELLKRAHERAKAEGVSADDDAALVERLGALVRVVSGDPRNVKVTTPFDLELLRSRVLSGVA